MNAGGHALDGKRGAREREREREDTFDETTKKKGSDETEKKKAFDETKEKKALGEEKKKGVQRTHESGSGSCNPPFKGLRVKEQKTSSVFYGHLQKAFACRTGSARRTIEATVMGLQPTTLFLPRASPHIYV